tara:strand:+ start:467 stop:1009 length:543 start_codon:yes stop_codon:yes gene_type:complete
MNYKEKYLKYKLKYFNLNKNKLHGGYSSDRSGRSSNREQINEIERMLNPPNVLEQVYQEQDVQAQRSRQRRVREQDDRTELRFLPDLVETQLHLENDPEVDPRRLQTLRETVQDILNRHGEPAVAIAEAAERAVAEAAAREAEEDAEQQRQQGQNNVGRAWILIGAGVVIGGVWNYLSRS